MRIPLTEWLPGPDRMIRVGGVNRPSWYKTALYNTLIHLRPVKCLEIGTRFGGTARVFSRYFSMFNTKGTLLTCDITRLKKLELPGVTQLFVFPHSNAEAKRDILFDGKFMVDGWDKCDDSVTANVALIQPNGPFDFVYIDGDHTMNGVTRDWEIAKQVCPEGTPVLFDDSQDDRCAVKEFLGGLGSAERYDFDDWPMGTGVTLVRR